jgi:hypothetical protein
MTQVQFFMIGAQLNYLLSALQTLNGRGLAVVEVRHEAMAASNAALRRRMRGTVWTAGGCRSWYQDRTGLNTALWPAPTWRFWLATRRLGRADHLFDHRQIPPMRSLPIRSLPTR